ncbi:MAG: single-stranded DNA-binding protein [Oscillospiraceae bacterium]|jgi:single-strand DNA-binding protein|nr:single-stranded DNA-binding protein [Oscillospiraceae bacterium]
MLNVAVIMGRLTFDPELKSTQSGLSVCSFTVAVDRGFKSNDGSTQADFIRVVAWRQTAEFVAKYFKKGSMIAVEGSIQTRNYEDKNGNKREAVEIVANRVSFTGSKAESGTGRFDAPPPPDAPPSFERAQPAPSFSTGNSSDFEEIADDGDLPF